MNRNQKKEWIIKYAKKNKIEDILCDKYTNSKPKENRLKKYSAEIQSICAIFSVVIIGFISLYITYQNYQLTNKQTNMMQSSYKPIISLEVAESEENNDLKNVKIVNKGSEILDYDAEIIAYGNVMCNENYFGAVPIRVFFLNAINHYNYYPDDCLMSFSIYHRYGDPFAAFYDEFSQLVENVEVEKYYWDIQLLYCIKIKSVDVMNNEYVDFFLTDGYWIERISEESGTNIVEEYHTMIVNVDGSMTSKENFYLFNELDAECIFKYALEKIRGKNLYISDDTGSKVLYGGYEP